MCLVQEHQDEYRALWAAVELITPKIGCPCYYATGLDQTVRDRQR